MGRYNKKITRGLTDVCQSNSICNRCTIPLNQSDYRGVTVFFSTNRRTATGFLCSKCVLSSKGYNQVTELELEDFITRKNKVLPLL